MHPRYVVKAVGDGDDRSVLAVDLFGGYLYPLHELCNRTSLVLKSGLIDALPQFSQALRHAEEFLLELLAAGMAPQQIAPEALHSLKREVDYQRG